MLSVIRFHDSLNFGFFLRDISQIELYSQAIYEILSHVNYGMSSRIPIMPQREYNLSGKSIIHHIYP